MMKYALALAMMLSATIAGAQSVDFDNTAADEAWFQTLPDQESEVELEEAQWHSGRRSWTCWARNRRGMTFWGQAWSREGARRIAMNRCVSRSSACAFAGCR